MITSQDILNAAMAMPDDERVQLIEALLATFDSSTDRPEDVAKAWRETARSRAAELDTGTVRPISWDEVRQEGERRIHDRSSP